MPSFESARLTFLDHLNGLNRSENTIAAYGSDLAQFGAYLNEQGVVELNDITPSHVSGWMTDLSARGLSGSSRNRKFQAHSAFHRHQVVTGQVTRSPTLGLDAPHSWPRSRQPEPFT